MDGQPSDTILGESLEDISLEDQKLRELERERKQLEKENAERKRKLEKLKQEERASQEAIGKKGKFSTTEVTVIGLTGFCGGFYLLPPN